MMMGSHLPCSRIHKHKSFCRDLSTRSSLGSPAQFSPDHNHHHDCQVDGGDDHDLDDNHGACNHADHDDKHVNNEIYGNQDYIYEDVSILVTPPLDV